MSTDCRPNTLLSFITLAVLCASCLPAQAAPVGAKPAPARTSSPASAAPGPFADLPVTHPAYVAGDTLAKLGIPFDRSGCYAPRTLTRYEFAVAWQRMYATVRTAVRFVDGESGPGPDFGEPQGELKTTFTDVRKLRRALELLGALGREFTPELSLLQAKPAELLSEVAGWYARAGALVVGTRKASTPARSGAASGSPLRETR